MAHKCECTKLKDAVARLFHAWLMYGHKDDQTLDAMLNVFSQLDSQTKKDVAKATSEEHKEGK